MKRVFLAFALLAIPVTARAGEADPIARDVLRSDPYRFCREKNYPLTPDEHAWCPLVGETNDACPALPAACKLPPVDRREALELRAGRGRPRDARDVKPGNGKDDRGREGPAQPSPPQDTRKAPEPERSVAMPDLSGLAKVLLFVVLVAFVVTVARALARSFAQSRGEEAPPDDAPPREESAKPEPTEVRGPVETDVERLLARARASASRGDYARAIDAAHAALLRRLDGDGLIEIHPSRTNGDYVRALADRPDLRRAVRDVVRDVEQAQFGSSPPSEALFRRVLDRVTPLVGRALGVALLCFGLGVATSCAEAPQEEHFLSGDPSPSGTSAIGEVLRKRGFSVRYRSEPLGAIDGARTLVLLPGVSVDAAAWKRLLAWARDEGGRLVLAGVEPPPELGMRLAGGGDRADHARIAWGLEASYGALELPIPPGTHLVSTREDEPDVRGALLLRGTSLYAVEQRNENGRIAVFADERLFTNAALAVPEDARFLEAFFGKGPRDVELCDVWTGMGASTPFESVQRARLTPLILQIFVLLGLLYLWRGRAFARLRDPPAEARRTFADHARALGLAYARARASRHVLGLYAVWALERLRERVHRSGRQGLAPLAEAIAARTGRPEPEIMRVLVDAASARDEAAPPSSFRANAAPEKSKRRDETESDLASMRELESFLAATGTSRTKSK